jgi:hypothetical protein
MSKQFLLFRDGRRLRAAHLELPRVDVPLVAHGRRFAPSGSFIHLSHITDPKKNLLGFAVDVLERVTRSADWQAWWETFDNRHLWDFWQAHIFLADPVPADWDDDGALLVGGGWVFDDGAGDYLLAIPDHNGFCFRPGEPTQFWRGLGFELAELNVSVSES